MTNVMFKKPRFVVPEATKDKTVTDIVMMVAGTTDPINTKSLKHEANTTYWDDKDKDGKDSITSFWAKVKELKFQYHDLHIEGKFFSWSGDNNTEERNLAAERLLNQIGREYPKFKRKEVHLHLIGHSHGGNVINEFTNLITTEKGKAFPEQWKIKSITYLSTPFFKKKHQLNHAKLHKACKIINVYNEYDLTQRLIADFSLINLEVFLLNFHMKNFEKGLEVLKQINTSAFDNLYDISIDDKTEGPFLWRETTKFLKGTNILTSEFIKYIKGIDVKVASLNKEKDEFVALLNIFLQWTYDAYNNFSKNSTTRKGGYGRSEFFQDLKVSTVIGVFNSLFDIKTGVNDSYILHLLARVFAEKKGLTDTIEINSWSPVNQAKSLSILPVNITIHDPYHSRGKKMICGGFISGAAGALQRNNLEEVLMRLFSQFVKPSTMKYINYGFHIIELFVSDNLDTEVKKLRKNIALYSTFISKYHVGLVTEKDEKASHELAKTPGSIPYLATVSHGLSHTQFWKDVEDGLRGAFSSGINPGYKKK
jgi:hypothetical protein